MSTESGASIFIKIARKLLFVKRINQNETLLLKDVFGILPLP